MNFEQIKAQVLQFFGFEPTSDQNLAIDEILQFLLSREDDEVFVLKGYAGTGKTTLVSALIKLFDKMKVPSVLMAPTGRAAKVFASYSQHQATTIHKKIYRQKVVTGDYGGFCLGENLHDHCIFFVDEASMIGNSSEDASMFGSGRLLEDLLKYVYCGRHCKLVLMGDTAQLPPVGKDLSPALDKDHLQSLGFQVRMVELRQVLRQQGDSLLLENASALRESITEYDVFDLPQIRVNKLDVLRLQGEDLVDTISASYHQVGMDECKIICRSNKRAVLFNQGIRARVLYKEDELSSGDLLMVAKNNYFWSQAYKEIPFIANGDLLEVLRVRRTMEMYGFRFADLDVRFMDSDWEISVRVLLDTLTAEAPALDAASQERLYQAVLEDYAHCHNKKELFENLRKDPWLNALQVKYGYAMTCHKSQGGQWKHIFLDQGYVQEDWMGLDYYRWLYTAITRATEKIYLVNFQDDFIAQG